jgi:radical SAM/Cys-rich protein
MDQERMVYERYKNASKVKEEALCCPTSYNNKYLKIIPEEIIEKDYGCGDPSKYILEGETVLDLGSGGGKLVYIIAQVVGRNGKVIGIDMNSDMLALARKYENEVANKLGYKNFEFKRGRIQNLKLDLEKLDNFIRENPVKDIDDYLALEFKIKELEKHETMIGDDNIDVVVSNCVLNLVRDEEKKALFKEIYRVLKKDGRAVISDIVSDKDIPKYMKEDPELWSGCISGAMREDLFIQAFKEAGFKDVDIINKDENPWRVIDGINFYSRTVSAYKGEKRVKYHSCCGTENILLSFEERIKRSGFTIKKDNIEIVQINVGGLCNQACNHCHILASPNDNRIMGKDVMERIFSLIENSGVKVIDITGGAPELNPYIEFLIKSAKRVVSKIIFRTNLTALMERDWLVNILKDKKISLYASLPSLEKEELDSQRGNGTFQRSIHMLKKLNESGFGKEYELNIVHNPVKVELPNEDIGSIYEKTLKNAFGINFNRLISITNAPIGKFAKFLESKGQLETYKTLLNLNFNSCNLTKLMCRNLLNIGYDGSIYDCDFNNALGLNIGNVKSIASLNDFIGKEVVIDDHCYACTAKKGSSCFGSS